MGCIRPWVEFQYKYRIAVSRALRHSIIQTMKCFQFHSNGEKKKESDPRNPSSGNSASSDHIRKQSRLKSDSRDGPDTKTRSRGLGLVPSKKPSNLKVFTLAEMKQVTKNFSNEAKIGEGGFGCVFKGTIRSSEDPSMKIDVAVKQLGRRKGGQGHKEWMTEVNLLGVVEHPNLVKLIGYCAEDDERGIQRLLIYEYVANGTVEDHLSMNSTSSIPWDMRLKIAFDTASGLAYLHEEMDFQIIFRDFKSSNILLDEQWSAKLSDFGLARLGPPEGHTHVSTAVSGTLGYAAPEYIRTGHLKSKSDVWSYGVFLYELITGRRPMDHNRPKSEQKLLEWVKPHISDYKKFVCILDPRLEGEQISASARKLSHVANRCLVKHPKERPKMSEVKEMINEVVVAYASKPTHQLPLTTIEEPRAKVKTWIAHCQDAYRPIKYRYG